MNINTLNLANDKPPVKLDRKIARRMKLVDGATVQSQFAKEEASGTKITTRKWYWKEPDETYRASLKLGRVVLELAKGKFSVRCNSLEEVSEVYAKLAMMVTSGDFDEQLDGFAAATRKQFNKDR